MKIVLFITFLAVALADEQFTSVKKPHEIASVVNSATDSTWKATAPHSVWPNDASINLKSRLGVLHSSPLSDAVFDQDEKLNNCEANGLPEEFDARKHWPECALVIGHIFDQGHCGSCWAVSIASVMSDRVCIASQGNITASYSVQQLTSCCHKCHGEIIPHNDCTGGYMLPTWEYIKKNGLSTGGDHNSKKGCQPYLHKNCDHHLENPIIPACPTLQREKSQKCKLHCYNTNYEKTFKEDRIKVDKYYQISPCAAMNEIHKYGPIVATFAVYEDFFTYKSGVYQYTTGKLLGHHAVRVIGWGKDNGTPYWLVANSWNEHWGIKGLFKIKRGDNEVWFEDDLSAGRPKL